MKSKIYIIAELCGQWGGSVSRAEQMILQCKMAGADAVKVQLYDTFRMPGEGRERWEYLSMKKDQFLKLKDYSSSLNIDFFASVFHEDRFQWILESDIKVNKIASGLVKNNFKLCEDMISSGMPTYVSLGRWEKETFPFDGENVKYFHCVSKYPHDYEEAERSMPSSFDKLLCGYSDHCIGIEACKLAVSRGASIIEKHYTTDKNLQCKTESAHVCSMEYDELLELRKFCDKYEQS